MGRGEQSLICAAILNVLMPRWEVCKWCGVQKMTTLHVMDECPAVRDVLREHGVVGTASIGQDPRRVARLFRSLRVGDDSWGRQGGEGVGGC